MIPEYGFVKMHDIILETLGLEQRTTLHKYVWYLHYAFKAFRHIRMDVDQMVKTVKIKLPENGIIHYPIDMVGWIKIGYKNGDRIVAATNDQSIFRESEDDGRFIPRDGRYRFVNFYDQREGYRMRNDLSGHLHAHNLVGYFSDNAPLKRFDLSAEWKDDVYLEYIGSCFDPDTETEVHVGAADYIVGLIRYFDRKYRFGDSDRETEGRRIAQLRDEMQYKARISNVSLDGILRGMQTSTTMSTKY